jgi:excinuclease ABC subunit C
VTAPQRVTAPAPGDADICGWAAGVLVRFEVRDGRLSTWTQRACAESTAWRQLADTPPEWAGFAQHNAELAALLGG